MRPAMKNPAPGANRGGEIASIEAAGGRPIQTIVSISGLQAESRELPQFVRDLLASPPAHGGGVHQWLFRVARQLHAHRSPAEIEALLAAAVHGCGRAVPAGEIRAAVENARACAWQPASGFAATGKPTFAPKWPERDAGEIRAIAEATPDALVKLRSASFVKVDSALHDAASLLERLFPDPKALLCAAGGVAGHFVRPRRIIAEIAGELSHIVPSPMTKPRGVNKQGQPSSRCLDNTGPREYLVTECDEGDKGTQAAVILRLAALAPLAVVIDSAGKSLHAWWHCRGVDESRLRRFFALAVRLGADPATWTRCQLVRMPLGWRDDRNARQEVIFFEPRNTAAGRKVGR